MIVSVQERMGCSPNSKVTAPRVHQDVQLMRTERPRHIKSACKLCADVKPNLCVVSICESLNNEIKASCVLAVACLISMCPKRPSLTPPLKFLILLPPSLSLLIFRQPVSVSLHGQNSQQILWMKPRGRLRERNIGYFEAMTKNISNEQFQKMLALMYQQSQVAKVQDIQSSCLKSVLQAHLLLLFPPKVIKCIVSWMVTQTSFLFTCQKLCFHIFFWVEESLYLSFHSFCLTRHSHE